MARIGVRLRMGLVGALKRVLTRLCKPPRLNLANRSETVSEPESEIGEQIRLEGEGKNLRNTPLAASVLQDRDRVTLTGHIHFEHYGDPPHSVDFPPCSYFTETQGEVYKRRISVEQEWKPLPLGWFAEEDLPIGLIVIVNQEGTVAPTATPTEEEEADVEKRVVELTFGAIQTLMYLPPRLPFFVIPVNAKSLQLRCQHGKARCAVHIFPK